MYCCTGRLVCVLVFGKCLNMNSCQTNQNCNMILSFLNMDVQYCTDTALLYMNDGVLYMGITLPRMHYHNFIPPVSQKFIEDLFFFNGAACVCVWEERKERGGKESMSLKRKSI